MGVFGAGNTGAAVTKFVAPSLVAAYGWQMVPKGPGNIEGTLILREHRAVVDVRYDTKTYSIKYKDSSNLQYDGASIHKNYNGWIQNLDNGIRARLTGL